jgi:hypothetical protein
MRVLTQTRTQAYFIHAHDTSDKRKDALTLLEIVENDIDYCEEVLGAPIIAWCCDAGGDSRAMRVRLVKKPNRTHIIQLDCWGHQVCDSHDEATQAHRNTKRFNWCSVII